MKISNELSEVMTIDELAKFLRCKRRAIYSLTRSRAQSNGNPLPVLRLGIGMRFSRASVLAWMARGEARSETAVQQ
jgi:excisionase family DNA binding protein